MRQTSTHARSRLHQQLRRHPGFSLTEVMMGLGIVTSLGAAVYWFYNSTTLNARVKQEQSHVNAMVDSANKAFGRVGSFEGMTNQRAMQEGWAPKEMIRAGALRNAWDTPVTLSAQAVNGRANAGLRLTYADLPPEACSKLATAIASSMWDVEVEGTSVMSAQRGSVEPNDVIARCAARTASDVAFVYYDGGLGTLAEAAPLTLACPPVDRRALACPAGEFGYIQQEREAVCSPTGAWDGRSWNAWSTTLDTCDPNIDCVAAGTCPGPLVPASQPCVAPSPQTRNVGCPSGQNGSAIETRTASCPSPTGAYIWSSWSASTNTCTPAGNCPAPESRTPGCPAGQAGAITEQRDCQDVSGGTVTWGDWYAVGNTCGAGPATPALACWETIPATCPPPTSCTLPVPNPEINNAVPCALPQLGVDPEQRQAYCLGPTAWEWSYWYKTPDPSDDTCYDCPPDDTENRDNPEIRVLTNCPAGQYGTANQSRLQPQSRTRTYDCPAAAGPGVAQPWSPWANSGPATPWTPALVCSPCPAPVVETEDQWVADTCPAGQLGTIEVQQRRTRTRSYNCPANTAALPAPSFTAWSAYSPTGATRNSTCYTCPPSSSSPISRAAPNLVTPIACPAGQVGDPPMVDTTPRTEAGTRTVTYNCPAAGGPAVANAPVDTWSGVFTPSGPAVRSGACVPPCVAPAPFDDYACDGPYTAGPSGCIRYSREMIQTTSYSCPAPTGAYSTTTGPWNLTGNYCDYEDNCGSPPPPTPLVCSNPAPASTPACPSGGNQSGGSWSQAPAPSCTWAYNGGSCPSAPATPSPTCSNPAPSSTPSCPSGGNESGGSWSQAPAPSCTWTYGGGSCPPPTCSNPAPVATPSCPSGGNQTGGSWSQAPAPTCTWAYSGGSCPAPAAPPVSKGTVGSLVRTYFNTSPASARRIMAFLSVGDVAGPPASFTNPGDWGVSWNVTQEGAMGGFSGSDSGSGFSIDFYCADSGATEGEWTVSADVEHTPTGTTSSFSWFVRCQRDNL